MNGFEPGRQSGIVYLGAILPELGSQAALNVQVPQHQHDYRKISWKMAPDILYTHVQSGDATVSALV